MNEVTKPRACQYCGQTDTMEDKRSDAKFCDVTCRKQFFRRKKGVKAQFKMVNRIRTDTLERMIAQAEGGGYELTAAQALRMVASTVNAPIREDLIAAEAEEWRRALDLSQKY